MKTNLNTVTVLTFGFMWWVDRDRENTFFFERGTGRQELAFGRAAEQAVSTTGFINPDIGANLELSQVYPQNEEEAQEDVV
jgi:hypothetical protein